MIRRPLNFRTLIPAAFLAVGLAACGEDAMTPTPGAEFGDLPADNISFDVRLRITEQGVRKADLVSDTAFFYQGDSRTDLRGVEATFYDPVTGRESGRLTSQTGLYDMESGAFTATGDAVLIVQVDGEDQRIESEELHYDVARERIWSDRSTTLREDGRVFRGSGFESDLTFQNIRVTQLREEEGGARNGGEITF